MAFSEFRGNPQIVTALRGALRSGRVPHALLFTGPHGVGKFTLARLFAQAANCERLTDDACGECHTCQRIALLAEPQRLIEQGLIERGESASRMVSVLGKIAELRRVGIFPRFEVMREWHENQALPIDSFVIADGLHMNDWGYACFAQLLGDDIIKSVGQIKFGVAVPSDVRTYRPM